MKQNHVAQTKAENMVIRVLLCAVVLSCVVLSSCSNDDGKEALLAPPVIEFKDDGGMDTTVTIHFTRFEIQAMTRADVSSVASHLDLWISDGVTTQEIHQSKTDEGYGTVSLMLDKQKTYTLYAVAHNASPQASLAEGIISFPGDEVTESFFYTTTFTPSETTEINCEMQRVVGKFVVSTTDLIPEGVAKIRITAYDTFNRLTTAGAPTNSTDRELAFDVPSGYIGQTITFNMILLASQTESTLDIKVEALDSDNSLIQERTFSSVPIRANYKTTYQGEFFNNREMRMTFSCAEWLDYDPISF